MNEITSSKKENEVIPPSHVNAWTGKRITFAEEESILNVFNPGARIIEATDHRSRSDKNVSSCRQ
jgi:hypothetical protein